MYMSFLNLITLVYVFIFNECVISCSFVFLSHLARTFSLRFEDDVVIFRWTVKTFPVFIIFLIPFISIRLKCFCLSLLVPIGFGFKVDWGWFSSRQTVAFVVFLVSQFHSFSFDELLFRRLGPAASQGTFRQYLIEVRLPDYKHQKRDGVPNSTLAGFAKCMYFLFLMI